MDLDLSEPALASPNVVSAVLVRYACLDAPTLVNVTVSHMNQNHRITKAVKDF